MPPQVAMNQMAQQMPNTPSMVPPMMQNGQAPVSSPSVRPPPPPGNGPPRRAAPSPSMVAIMESQADEMRKLLSTFKVNDNPLDPNVPPHADILVFGPSGSGKSSLIRTFFMALQQVPVPADFAQRIIVKDTAMNEGTLKYISAVIKPRKLDHRGATSSSAIICHDTRGHIWMDEKEQRQFGVILDGNVKDDSIVQQRNHRYARLLWEFWRKDTDLFPAEILVRRNGLATRPHALLFVFDGSMDEIPNGDEETQFYRDSIAMARMKGYKSPQVVLTRIDRVEDRLARCGAGEDPELKLRQVLDRKIEDVVTRLDVPRNSVHFIENYHSDGCYSEGRNVAVDFHALRILSQCCSHADTFVAQHLRERSQAVCQGGQCALQ